MKNKRAPVYAAVAGVVLASAIYIYDSRFHNRILRRQAEVESQIKTTLSQSLPKDPAAVLALSQSNNVDIRAWVAGLTDSQQIIKKLSTDPNWYVRHSLVSNVHTSDKILRLLSADSNSAVSYSADARLSKP